MNNYWKYVLLSSLHLTLSFSGLAQQSELKVGIINLGGEVNTPFSEYAPVINADGTTLIFTSRRPVTEKEIKKNRESFENVYICHFDEEKEKWSQPQLLPEVINLPKRHTSALAISNDGQRLLIYRNDPLTGNGSLFESKLHGETWSEPVLLPAPINSKHHESTASFAPDGRTIYFVSERPKGKGGKDIWYCKQDKDGNWGEAINIGYPINTKEDEEGVFIHPDGKTLYFSSKGHHSVGLGGYDIYRSVLKDGEWSEPENLGPPVNTPGDDVFFVMEANGKTGYYSSSKPGGYGEKDIYKVVFDKAEDSEPAASLTLLKGVISDEVNGKPIEASISIVDNETEEELSTFTSNSATGKYLISLPAGKNYGLSVSADGYLFHSENFTIADTASYLEVIKNIALKTVKTGSKIALKNIFYDSNKATLRDESKSELNRLVRVLNENNTIRVEVSSHTDSQGAKEYNEQLSQQRAQSVVNYLIEKGIAQDRLIAKGYGQSVPIASNDTEEGRQMNRRTEFTIISK